MTRRLAAIIGDETSLKADTVTYAAATLVERAIALALVPLLTHAVSPELFGVWTQVLVSVSLLGSLVAVGLGTTGVKFLSGAGTPTFIHDWFRRLTVPVLLNAGVLIAGVAAAPRWSSNVVFGDPQFGLFAVELALLVASEAVFDMQTNMLRARQRIRAISQYTVVKSLIRLGAVVGVLYVADGSLDTAVGVIVGLQTLLVVAVELREVPRREHLSSGALGGASTDGIPPPTADAISVRGVARFAVPVFLHSALVMFHVAGVRFVLAHMLDVEDVGVFAVAIGLTSSTVGLVFAILGFTLYPRMASAWNRGAHEELRALLQRGLQIYALVAAPIAALLIAAPAEIVTIIAGEAYTVDVLTMALLVGGVASFGAFQLIFYLVLTSGGLRRNFLVLGTAIAVQFGGAASLIEAMGLRGAALAYFLGNVALLLGTRRQQQRVLATHVQWFRLFAILAAALAMGFAAAGGRVLVDAWPVVARALVAVATGVGVFAAVGGALGLHRHAGLTRSMDAETFAP